MEVLGLRWQKQLAKRAGVRPEQVSGWMTGKQRPPWSRLEAWADREGWPVEIFAEGGPMPSEVIGEGGLRSGDDPVRQGGDSFEPPDTRVVTMIARQVAQCVERTLRENELPYSQATREAVAHALCAFAGELRRDGADVSDLTLLALKLMGRGGSE